MNIEFWNVVVFLVKAVLIEWTIELLRFISYGIWYNEYSKEIWLTHKNWYFKWFINSLETLAVLTLLYLGYSFIFIVVTVFCFIFIVKQIGNVFLCKNTQP